MHRSIYIVVLNFALDGQNQTELVADDWKITDNALTFYLRGDPTMIFNNRSWTTFYPAE